MLSHKKPLIATVIILVLVSFTLFSLTTFTTTYASLVVAVLQAIDDSEDEYESPEEMEDTTSTGQSVIDGIVFYDKWHRMCEELDWEKVESYLNNENPILSGAGSPTGVSKWDNNYLAVIKLYSLVCEILTRQEINPGLTSDPFGEGQHTECDLCLNPLWVLGKIATESGIKINPEVSYGGATYNPDNILYSSSTGYVKDPISDGWFSQKYVAAIPWSFTTTQASLYLLQNLNFLMPHTGKATLEAKNGSTLYGLEAIEDWFGPDWKGSRSDTISNMCNSIFHGYDGVEATGPVAQDLLYNYNWNNGYSSHASIFISRQENPTLEEEKRAIYGLRGAIYKGTGKYLTGDIWSNGGLSTAPLETAPQEEIASNIGQGYLDPNDPLCYQSRPAIYYYPDALYTLCLSLRTTYERDKDKDYLSRFSSLTGETKSNVYIMILAGTQAGTDGAVNMSNWLATQSSYDLNTLFTVATAKAGYQCGITNLNDGVGHIEAFHYIIEQLYSREDLRRTTLAESVSGSVEDSGAYSEFLWPLSESYQTVNYMFGKIAQELGYGSQHSGMDIFKSGIRGQEVKPIAPGVVVNVYRGCPHNDEDKVHCNCGDQLGNHVVIYHGNGILSVYAHMQTASIPQELNVGDFIFPDYVIGKVGTTGYSEGSHLHLEINIMQNIVELSQDEAIKSALDYYICIRGNRNVVEPMSWRYYDVEQLTCFQSPTWYDPYNNGGVMPFRNKNNCTNDAKRIEEDDQSLGIKPQFNSSVWTDLYKGWLSSYGAAHKVCGTVPN